MSVTRPSSGNVESSIDSSKKVRSLDSLKERDLLELIAKELRVMNLHLQVITGEELTHHDAEVEL